MVVSVSVGGAVMRGQAFADHLRGQRDGPGRHTDAQREWPRESLARGPYRNPLRQRRCRSASGEDNRINAEKLAGFFGYKDVATLVRATLAAGTVRQLALVAVGALGEAGGGEEVVAAALG